MMTIDTNVNHQDILSNVYVIYGNNIIMRDEIYTFLKGLSLQPITKEMASDLTGEGAPFADRIIDVAFEYAQAVLVLLSGGEQVCLRKELQQQQEADYEINFSPQPTLDQIFEAGYAFGKYPERTVLLQVDNIRPFSDIVGRDILSLTGKKEEYLRLRERLRSIGCNINNGESLRSLVKAQEGLREGIKTNPSRVFVIHGRNEHIEKELFKFLKMLNLSPIAWREAVNTTQVRSPYIGKILEALLQEAQAVLVLLTGDDEVKNTAATDQDRGSDQIYLPRPNVVFETGMSLSNTRLASKTILVQSGSVKIWDAINGRHRIKLSDKLKHRWELANSLKEAGCSVQIPNDELLRRIGNFGI